MNLKKRKVLLIKALKLTLDAHKNQVRKGDLSPYVGHLIDVVSILFNAGFVDDKLLTSALLHDVIEDTDVTLEYLENKYGSEVKNTVMSLTDDKNKALDVRRKEQLNKTKAALSNVQLIKLADAISNAKYIPILWSMERANDSMNHLVKLAKACSKESEKLAETLTNTVEKSLNSHQVLTGLIAKNVDIWLNENSVYYSFNTDKFYVFLSNKVDKTKALNAQIGGKYDIYLRAKRNKSLQGGAVLKREISFKYIVDELGTHEVSESTLHNTFMNVLDCDSSRLI
jgi:hypothetical protein